MSPNWICPSSGGEEVILDVGGQDATEAFEDVGHSDEARETLEKLLVGTLKRQVSTAYPPRSPHTIGHIIPNSELTRKPPFQPGDPAPKSPAAGALKSSSQSDSTSAGIGVYAVILIGGLLAYASYQYLQSQQTAA